MTASSKVVEFDKLVKALNKIIFGSEIETVTLDGIVKPTISNFLNSYAVSKADLSYVDTKFANINAALAAYVGGRKSYTTLALVQAAQSSLPANTAIEVTNDPIASNNGTYQWDGTALTKSTYDPLTQAKADATIKANAAEAKSRTHTNSVIFSGGGVENIYETPVDPPAPISTGTPATIVYAQPSPVQGFIYKAYGRLASSVTGFKVKVFDLVGPNFILASESNVPVNTNSTTHTLDMPLEIKVGQYVGFYTQGGVALVTLAPGSKPYGVEHQDASIVAASNYFTAGVWQMYFQISISPMINKVNSISNNVVKNTRDIGTMLNTLDSRVNFYRGPETLIGGTLKELADKEYIPCAKPIGGSALLQSVEFNLLEADKIGFFTAKIVDNLHLEITHETDYVAYQAGVNIVNFEDFIVKKGEYIGWKALGRQVSFDTSVSYLDGYYSVTKSGDILTLDSETTYTFSPRIKFTLSEIGKSLQMSILSQAQYDALTTKDPNTLYAVI